MNTRACFEQGEGSPDSEIVRQMRDVIATGQQIIFEQPATDRQETENNDALTAHNVSENDTITPPETLPAPHTGTANELVIDFSTLDLSEITAAIHALKPQMPEADIADTTMQRFIRNAAIKNGNSTPTVLEAMIINSLTPLLQDWLEKNMPEIMQKFLAAQSKEVPAKQGRD